MDLGRLDVKDPLFASGGESSSLYGKVNDIFSLSRATGDPYLLGEVGHGECLVEKPEFPALAFLVIGITEDTTVQQRSVNIRNHGADIPGRVWRLARRREFDRVEVVDYRWVEVDRISFVE